MMNRNTKASSSRYMPVYVPELTKCMIPTGLGRNQDKER